MSDVILHGEGKRYQLIDEGNNELIRDTLKHDNICFAASSGFGTRSSTLEIMRRFVDLLNTEEASKRRY